MGDRQELRKELAALLKKEKNKIVHRWSSQTFNMPRHRRLKNIIPMKMYAAGMGKFLKALAYDFRYPTEHKCGPLLEELILKDYLSVNTIEDTIQGFVILRNILDNILLGTYKDNVRKLARMRQIVDATIDKEILYQSKIYRKRDFSRLETIMKYGKKLITIHDLNKLCHLTLEAAVKESNSDRASLMLLDKDGYLRIKSSVGIPRRVVSSTLRKFGSGIAGRAAKTARPIIISEGQKIKPVLRRSLLGLGLASAVSIPIITQGRVIGVLNLGKYPKKPFSFFDQEDIELLFILAYEAGAAISNCRLIGELQDLYIGSIISLASALDARDHYTQGHSERVTRLATAVARRLKLSNGQIDNIKYASMFHDIGKIGIPDRILLKPAKLTKAEFAVIRRHPILAVKILKHIPRLKNIIPIIYHEHERYDGKGYVKGLKGGKIPLESRIIFVADAYEAMTSDRPYRKALSKKGAVEELRRGSGTQFDPTIVNALLKVIKK